MAISRATFVSKLLFLMIILFLANPSSLIYASNHNNNNKNKNNSKVFNVLSFGAEPDGVSDSTGAFLGAWAAACAWEVAGSDGSAQIHVPRGRFVIRSLAFRGECKSPKIRFKIDGTLVGPADYRVLGEGGNKWISFEGVAGVSIVGGRLDGGGASLWACKTAAVAGGGDGCPAGATTLSFTNSKDIKIIGLMSLNSQMFHITINGCRNVHIKRVKVIADGNSPNTDGIHVQLSTNVVVKDSSIMTGDDCISIGPGANNLWLEHIFCGPGHGISIGSLAKDRDEPGVRNVTVKNVVFNATQNGLRIKTWANPSNGFVKGVRFLDVTMKNVQNPIVIDQNYCPHNLNCPNQVSGIKITDVTYKGIRGTSATPVAIKFDCSTKYPCTGIELNDVNLSCLDDQVAQSWCSHVDGKAFGKVQPNNCL